MHEHAEFSEHAAKNHRIWEANAGWWDDGWQCVVRVWLRSIAALGSSRPLASARPAMRRSMTKSWTLPISPLSPPLAQIGSVPTKYLIGVDRTTPHNLCSPS
jgi:hypothetical protein